MPKLPYLFPFLFLLILSLTAPATNPAFATGDPNEPIVRQYIELINAKDWNGIPALWIKRQRETLAPFFNDKRNNQRKAGLFNIKQAALVSSRPIPYEYGSQFLPSFIDSLPDPQISYVAAYYQVHREDKYHLNGVNYFFIVTANENGNRRIALTPHVPTDQLISDGYGFGTPDEKSYRERRIKYVRNRGSKREP